MAGGADQLIGQLADDVVEGLPVRVGDPQLGEESLQLGGSPVGVGILKGLEQSAFLLKGIGGLPGAAFLLQPHQRCLQFLGGYGLEQKIEHPHADRLPGIVELVVAGEDDDLGAGEALLDLACEGDAVAKGHLQIGDHQIGGHLLSFSSSTRKTVSGVLCITISFLPDTDGSADPCVNGQRRYQRRASASRMAGIRKEMRVPLFE